MKRTGDNPESILFAPAQGANPYVRIKLEQWQNTNQVGISSGTDEDFGYTAPLNTWVHLVFVGTSSVTTLYVNGVAHATTISEGYSLPLHRIGAESHGGGPMEADIDDVRVYAKALTAGEVAALHDEVSPSPTTLTVSLVSNTVTEDIGSVVVTATLDQPAKTATTVTFTATDGTATKGTDFTVPATFTAVIAKGATEGTATLMVTDDADAESSETFSLAASGGGLTAAPVTVTITDNDTAGVTVSDNSLSVVEGAKVFYTVVLDSQPSADVIVTATSGASATATVAPATRTFTTGNWSTAQSFTVSGVKAGATTITHAVSGDTNYGSSLEVAGVGVTVVADSGLRVVPVVGSLGVWWAPPSGGGTVNSYTVQHKLASADDSAWMSASVDADTGHYRVSSVSAGTYVVRVAAVVGGQQGGWVTSSSVVVPASASSNAAPEVIPRLRSWVGGAGSLSLTSASRIVVSTGDAGEYRVASSVTAPGLSQRTLLETAGKIKKDLKEISGLDLPVVSAASPVAGDVFLQLTDTADSGLATEGYELWVGDVAVIRGNTSAGVFWGSRTLLQVLGQSSDDRSVKAGWVRDWPGQGVRMIALDVGRKYFEMDYLEDLFRQMSWHKMNMFNFHFSEGEGLRLYDSEDLDGDDEGDSAYVGLTDPATAYSKADVARLEAVAAEHHITIMPGFEFPGHATAISDHFDIGFGDGRNPCGANHIQSFLTPNFVVDMTNSAAVNRVKQIITKFTSWFSGPYVHIGGEEVAAALGGCPRVQSYISGNAALGNFGDVLVAFINDMNTTIKGLGKRTVIYNGFEHSPGPRLQTLDGDIVINFWESGRGGINSQASRSGVDSFDIINIDSSSGFYLTPNIFHNLYPNSARIYDQWSPSTTDLGTGIAIWADLIHWARDGFFELFLRRPRAVLADRTWNTTTTPDTVSDLFGRIDKVGTPPGLVGFEKPPRVDDGKPSHYYNFEPRQYPTGHVNPYRPGTISHVQDEAGGLHGTSNYTSVDRSDKVVGLSSFSFDADREGIGIGGLDIDAPWTMSVWVKRTGNKRDAVLLNSRDERGRHRYVFLETGTARRVGFRTAAGVTHTFNYTAPSTWTHLSLVADATTTKLYVNGTLNDTVNASMPLPMHSIGAAGNAIRGKLDELKIWDEALTANQVVDDYRSRCAASGLIHHWTFDEVSGSTVTDSGSGGDDGTITDATWVAQGRLAGALSFDGDGDYLQVGGDALGVGGCGGGWTTALWVKRTGDNADSVLFSPDLSGSARAVVKLEQWQNTNEVGISGVGTGNPDFGYSTPLNSWVHLIIVGTSSDTKLYVNGTLAGTIGRSLSLPLHRIGAASNDRSFIDAELDDIRVYGHAKTASEVTALFDEVNINPPDPPTDVVVSPAVQQLSVAWTAPANNGGADITGYVVQLRAPDAARDRDRRWRNVSVSADTLSRVFSGLVGGATYEVRVAARNGVGRGDWSSVVSVEPLRPDPTALVLTTDVTNNRVGEGAGTVAVTATLDWQATSDVVVSLVAGSGTTATTTDDYVLPAAFTIETGEKAKTVDVMIVDDAVVEGNELLVLTTVVGGLSVTGVSLTVTDDDVAAVSVSETNRSVAVGSTAVYSVVLDSEPTADVTVTASSGDTGYVSVSGAVTFAPSVWNIPQTFTVTGVAVGSSTVTHAVSGSDPGYVSGLLVASVVVDVTMNATPPVVGLVSNIGQMKEASYTFNNQVHAQGFTTGSNRDGYKLTRVQANLITQNCFRARDVSTIRAELWSDVGGNPGSKIADLMRPNRVSTGAVSFHADGDGVQLSAGTTYYFMLYTTGRLGCLEFESTDSRDEDAGGAAGWSIADDSHFDSGQGVNSPRSSPLWDKNRGEPYQISVRGYAVPPSPTALTLTTDATNDTVGEDVGLVTVTATLDEAATSAVSVTLTASGTAVSGADYVLPSSFTIAVGETVGSGSVSITDDKIDEVDETIVLSASGTGLNVTGVTVTITDDDTAGVSLGSTSAVSVVEG
ncbi:MAG: family 20 glycosylhydrolase, partial [Acidimicrobiaceae bacterium]|nr:family 20 glycosylhydrolase [Acidimicrobiaceae bacterium]